VCCRELEYLDNGFAEFTTGNYMALSLPEFLSNELAAQRVVPFVGAGLSRIAGLPNWSELLVKLSLVAAATGLPKQVCEQIDAGIRAGRYELVADSLAEHFGENLGPQLAKLLDTSSLALPLSHRMLAEVDWPALITTNFDDLLGRALPASTATLNWKDASGIERVLRGRTQHIMYAHGNLSLLESIVLTPDQYRRCLRQAAYRTYLKSIFTNHTVLFLGFSFNDRDISSLLEDLREMFGQIERPHFAVLPMAADTDLRVRYLRQNFNVEVIPYVPSTEEHPEFIDVLRTIVDRSPGKPRDLLGALRALDEKRPGLPAAEYLWLYAETCRRLSEDGYVRSAWISFESELRRSERELEAKDRVQLTMLLVRLQLKDGQFLSAAGWLRAVAQLPVRDALDSRTLCEFANLMFEVGFWNYEADLLDYAAGLIREEDSDGARDEMAALSELFRFLHGDSALYGLGESKDL
jgi:hypothetical protein